MTTDEIEVNELVITSDGVDLTGTAWVPSDVRLAMIMHPGSGPSDRHNDELFAPIRATLLDQGVAVASFDKRGVGGSGGDWLRAGIVEQARDAAAAVTELKACVAGRPVGIFGHSQGGWVAVELTGQGDVDFVITNSGPAVTPRQQERFATGNAMRRAGGDEAAVAAGIELQDEIMQLCSTGVTFSEFERWSAPRAREIDQLVAAGAFVPVDPSLWGLVAMMGEYDPVERLSALTVPLLAVFGERDPAVPVQESVRILGDIVAPDLLTVEVINDGDHRMQALDGGFAPGYLGALGAFLARQVVDPA